MTSISFERLELLKEEYEYYEKLGSGKFGSVYKVICRTTGEAAFCYSSYIVMDSELDIKFDERQFQESSMQQNMFYAGGQVRKQD